MFAGIFGLLAVESFVVDPNAMATAVVGGLTFGRVALVGVLVVVGLGLFFKDQLAAVWAESKAAATTAAKSPSNPALPQAGTILDLDDDTGYIGLPLDDLSQGFAYARGMDEIYERQGVPLAERKRRLMAAVDSVCLIEVPPVPAEPAKGGAA